MEFVATFLIGIAAGVAGYRSYIESFLGRYIHTACDYCEYGGKKENSVSITRINVPYVYLVVNSLVERM